MFKKIFLTILVVSYLDLALGQEESIAAPIHYDLFLNLAKSQPTKEFTGSAHIQIECLVQSSKLRLNCKNLEVSIETANITEGEGIGEELKVQEILVQDDFCEIKFSGDLAVTKKYTLELDFTGKINSEPIGIFEEYYTEDYQSMTHLITTNFKGGNAHLAFPCFDDLKYKATFTVKVGHTNEYDVLTSTPLIKIVNEEDYLISSFKPTPLAINTDHFGFVLYQNMSKTSNPLVPIDIFHSQNFNKNLTTLTLTTLIGMRLEHTTFFGKSAVTNHYFIAAPFRTMQGRIDNWALSVVDGIDFLRTIITSTPEMYQETLQMYSHQLGLHWVEYEVTPDTWNEWWVSRGLAKFYEYYIPSKSKIYQAWIDWNQFVPHVTHKALDEGEVYQEFDAIEGLKTNERAAAIFNMIQSVMGLDNFNAGVKQFVQLFSGKTVKSKDLFDELTKQLQTTLPTDLQLIFTEWFNNDGYPIIRVTRKGTTVTLKQEPYSPSNASDALRYVPINYVTNDDLNFDDTSVFDWLLPDPNFELTIDNIPEKNLILLNKKQTGYYRVLYDESTYDILTDVLHKNHTIIHPLNRAMLIDDLGSFTRNGYVNYNIFCTLLEYLQNEKDYNVWSVANKHINLLFHKLRSSEAFDRFETLIREITKPHFDDLGLGTDIDLEAGLDVLVHSERLNRQYVADLACFSGVDTCVNQTMEYVEQLSEKNYSLVLPEMIPIMACTVFKHDYGVLDRLLAFLQKPSNESVEKRSLDLMASVKLEGAVLDLIIDSIGCSRNVSSLQATLDLSIIPSKTISITISRYTRRKLFESVVKGSGIGTEMGLKFMKKYYLDMNQRYDNMALVFKAFNGYILTDELLKMYTEVVRIYEAKFYPITVKDAAYETLTGAEKDVEWTNTYIDEINNWLSVNDYNGTTTEIPDSGTSMTIHIGVIFIAFVLSLLLY